MQTRIGIVLLSLGLSLALFVGTSTAQDENRLAQEAALGLDQAIVELVEYGSYGCAECRSSYQANPTQTRLEIYPGAYRYVFRNVPGVHPNDALAAEAAQCALDQSANAFWTLHHALFMTSEADFAEMVAAENFVELAAASGLDANALQSCLNAHRHTATVGFWAEQAQQLGIPAGHQVTLNGDLLDGDLDEAIIAVATERISREAVQGSDEPSVTIIEYGAYGCHACRLVHGREIVQTVMAEYGDEVAFVFRNFPFLSPHDPLAAEAAQCAFDQGDAAFWQLHDALFDLTDGEYARTDQPEEYVALAAQAGLDSDALASCLASEKHRLTTALWAQHGQEIGVNATPTFLVNGRQVNPLQLEEIIRSLVTP